MKFRLIIDKTKDEEVVATVHKKSTLTEQLEQMILQHNGADKIPVYWEEDMLLLPFCQIECITVLDGKTYAVDTKNRLLLVKRRLYELENLLPSSFIRINKSSIANEACLERFAATYSGGVNAVFKCGYTDYVSRRCFAQIKRRFENK